MVEQKIMLKLDGVELLIVLLAGSAVVDELNELPVGLSLLE